MPKSVFIGLVALTVAGGVVWVTAGEIFLENDDTLTPTGITTGEPDEYIVTEEVQAFFDECSGKRGVITGVGGVKERLPTTEEGYTCWYQERDCWDFLTYSMERFKGGNPGCPEANLVPKVPNPPPTPQPAAQPTPTPTPTPTPPPPPPVVIITPSANQLVGSWSGSGTLTFTGSLYCNTYSIDWSAEVSKVNEERVSGSVFDGEGDLVGTLIATWNGVKEEWSASISSDIFTTSNGTMDDEEVGGNIKIRDLWMPCEDIKTQSGSWHGTKNS